MSWKPIQFRLLAREKKNITHMAWHWRNILEYNLLAFFLLSLPFIIISNKCNLHCEIELEWLNHMLHIMSLKKNTSSCILFRIHDISIQFSFLIRNSNIKGKIKIKKKDTFITQMNHHWISHFSFEMPFLWCFVNLKHINMYFISD